MKPALCLFLFFSGFASLLAPAGPIIEQLRVTLLTGEDAMRGSSDAYLKLWFHGHSEPVWFDRLTGGISVDFPSLGNKLNSHSAFTKTFPVDPFDMAQVSNVGIHFDLPYSIIGHSTFLFNSPDEWHMDGVIVTGITATGEEYTIYNKPDVNWRFVRLNLYHDDSWRIDDWKSRALDLGGVAPNRVDEFRVTVRTGDDNLRPGSRAFCEVRLKNGWRFEHPIVSRPVLLRNHTSLQQVFRLPRLVDRADIDAVSLRYEADNSGGSTDEWNVQGFSVEARSGLTTREYLSGRTPRLWRSLAEDYSAQTEFNTSRSETRYMSPFGVSFGTDALIEVTVRTGGDDLRARSNAYLRLLLNDGGYYETRLNGSEEEWSGGSSVRVVRNLPAWIQLRHVGNFAMRYESGRRSGRGDDQWTLNGFSVQWRSSLVTPPGTAFATGRTPHHFSESGSWTPDVGVTRDPLNEEEVYYAVTEVSMEIPPVEGTQFVLEEPIHFEEWNDLIWENPIDWAALLKAAENERFKAYAFGLQPGEEPYFSVERLEDDPDTGGKRFLVRYARLLGVEDVVFELVHAADLRSWVPVPVGDRETTVVPDPVNRLEWVEVIVSGATVRGSRNHFRIEAGVTERSSSGRELIPGEAPDLPPSLTPPSGETGLFLLP